VIKLKTKLPGPKARRIIREDDRYISPSYTRAYPLVVKRARGVMVEDVDGNQFLDFTAGVAVCATGHVHPRVASAIKKQVNEFIHMAGTDFYYEHMPKFAKRLSALAPGAGPKRTFFSNSGTEAVECAFKLARYISGRPRMIAFTKSFHGRTMGSLSLTGSKNLHVKRFSPLVPGVTHVPYANCFRCPYKLKFPSCNFHCVKIIEEVHFKSVVPPEEVAAIIAEPIQGEGGYIVPPPGYHQELKKLAEKYGILYIADEVQSGFGRTGKMFAIEHWDTVPDILCLAKGIASGMPLGATVASAKLMTWPSGAHANTFGGNPVALAAASATLDLIEGGLMKQAATLGQYFLGELQGLMGAHRLIGDVRGMGLMIGIELVKDHTTREPAVKERLVVVEECFRRGLLLLGCGESSVRFSPALIVSKAQMDEALAILSDVLADVERRMN